VKTAFKLNAETPFGSKPVALGEAYYVFGLAMRLPSAIPSLTEIHSRVVADYQNYEAVMKARSVGTNFYFNAMVQMATGKTFAQAAIAGGQAPLALTPFSLSSTEVPEADGHAQVSQVKQAAFSTQPGHLSQFVPTADGGFVMYVQSLLPVDQAEKNKELPQFLSQLRRARENEAFNLWLNSEASRELANTPLATEMNAKSAATR